MDPLALIALLLAALVSLWLMRQRSRNAPSQPARPKAKDGGSRTARALEALDTVLAWPPEVTRVLTQPERQAYALLAKALPEHMLLAQVPLSRFIRVPTRNSYQEWMHRVSQLCADLVVCDMASQVLAVVEIRRAPGKDNERTQKRHQRMDRILRKAGIRVVVWNEEALPQPDEVLDKVLGVSQTSSTAEGAQKPSPRPAVAATGLAKPPSRPLAVATLHDEILAGESPDAFEAGLAFAEPTPSTWFDNLDSAPAPLGNPLER